ncbi:MAG: prephenate dehydratase [Rikenellaceae bacterium]
MKTVAIQGYEGSFHQLAARNYFGNDIQTVACATFREVARKLRESEVDYAVMAIENSIAGSIIANYSILQNHDLQVEGEVYLLIRQNLMALPGQKLEDIKEVQSHPMALLQCVDFLDKHPWRLVESEDTALSAQKISEGKIMGTAAIAGDLPAELFGLEILAPEINTIKNNATRFMVLKRRDNVIENGVNKASLYFKINNDHGALLKVLEATEVANVNMTKLQSYPIPSDPWHYLFHIDLEFSALEDYNKVVKEMREQASEIYIYGVYKKGEK